MKLIWISEGIRYFFHRIRVKNRGYKCYSGDAESIMEQIIEDCWDRKKQYFKVSTGHYLEFWTRDFGLVIDHLINLGYEDEVRKTLEYALEIFSKKNKITTTITPSGITYDFPCYAPDSLAYLTKALVALGDKKLINQHRDFLNSQIKRYFDIVIDKRTGLVRKDRHFSTMKDHAIRESSCYDNCMTAMLKSNIEKLGLKNPFKKYNYEELIKNNFWKKNGFVDDLSGNNTFTGDANVFPFYCGVFNDKKLWKTCFNKIKELGLDKPFPLRYYYKQTKEHEMILLEFLAKNWEHENVWPMLAMPFFEVLEKFKCPELKGYLNQYRELIEKNMTFIELFTPKGKPFKTLVYCADEGMLWSAVFLDMMKNY
ncbi:hypothetical protein JXA85_06495 [Candidatus Woesearchaeota archaeon]|nr:hypothetical protein [Candidatus Woesearchaeota archaeon]